MRQTALRHTEARHPAFVDFTERTIRTAFAKALLPARWTLDWPLYYFGGPRI